MVQICSKGTRAYYSDYRPIKIFLFDFLQFNFICLYAILQLYVRLTKQFQMLISRVSCTKFSTAIHFKQWVYAYTILKKLLLNRTVNFNKKVLQFLHVKKPTDSKHQSNASKLNYNGTQKITNVLLYIKELHVAKTILIYTFGEEAFTFNKGRS